MARSIQEVRLSSSLRMACKVCTMSDRNRMDCEAVGEVLGYPKGVCIVSHEGKLENMVNMGREAGRGE